MSEVVVKVFSVTGLLLTTFTRKIRGDEKQQLIEDYKTSRWTMLSEHYSDFDVLRVYTDGTYIHTVLVDL